MLFYIVIVLVYFVSHIVFLIVVFILYYNSNLFVLLVSAPLFVCCFSCSTFRVLFYIVWLLFFSLVTLLLFYVVACVFVIFSLLYTYLISFICVIPVNSCFSCLFSLNKDNCLLARCIPCYH